MNEAAMISLKDRLDLANETSISYTCSIRTSHFERALSKITPSVTDKVCLWLLGHLILSVLYLVCCFVSSTIPLLFSHLSSIVVFFFFIFQQREYYEALANKYQVM
jgi:SpoVK/Ycf46/Vps4 family AAA+-type ATPase